MENSSDIARFIGRFHIVVLHLPIGLLLALGFLELLSLNPKWRQATAANRFILVLTAPVAVLTAVCGWLLADAGQYDERLLFLHRWTGVAVAVTACILLLLHLRGWTSLYRAGVVVAIVLTVAAGHFGGSLTHGSGYLTRYGRSRVGKNARSVPGPESGDSGFSAVEPLLSEYCVSCHGPEKSKSGFRVDSFERLLAGGDSGPAVVPGDGADSPLLNRLLLPLEDDDHMPPDGKPQPAPGEIGQIRRWILSGAPH